MSSFFAGQQANQPSASQPAQQAPPQQQTSFVPTSTVTQQPAAQTQSAFFDSLLERGRRRPNDENGVNGLGQVPGLQLGLSDIGRRVRELGGAQGAGAHYVLAGSGVVPGTALRDLNDLNLPPAAAQAATTDTGAYVAHLQSQSTLALITESLNRSARDFDAFLERTVTIDWDAQRQRIYEHFGLVPKGAEAGVVDDAAGSIGAPDQRGFGRSTRRGRGPAADGRRDSSLKDSVFGASAFQKSVIGSPGRGIADQAALFTDTAEKAGGENVKGLDDRFLLEKERRLAQRVRTLNEARLEGNFYPILQQFASAENESGSDQTTTHLVRSYKALVEITNEDPAAERVTDPNAIRERQFADDYLDESPRSERSTKMKRRIIDGSRRYLEKLFMQELEALIARFPREARLGGVPTTINKIRAYVTFRASRKEIYKDNSKLRQLGDDYCWVVIYYLLRSGHLKEAVEYVNNNKAAFQSFSRNFVGYLSHYARSEDRRLSRDYQMRIDSEYASWTRGSAEETSDPYRTACYKIVGRCDLGRRQLENIEPGVEDWMWLQFALAREVDRANENAAEVFGLDEVRAVVREIGQRHFAKGQPEAPGGHGTFFFLQILGGLFEEAVAYLYPFAYASAVHFAIALAHYGVLRVSSSLESDTELLTFNTKQLPQISFGRMVGYYTRDFRAGDVEAATDYLALLCLNADLAGAAGKAQESLCHEALRELVLETREFAKLLGDVRYDGQRVKGAIEKRARLVRFEDRDRQFLDKLTIQAAAVAEDNGRTTDAVLLYHLANEYDRVVTVTNRALSEAIAVEIGQEGMRLEPLKSGSENQQPQQQQQQQGIAMPQTASLSLSSIDSPAELAQKMIGLYNSNALYYNKIKPRNRDACGMLMRMMDARALVERAAWADALDTIDGLQILPLRAGGDMTLIRGAAQSFNNQQQLLVPSVSTAMSSFSAAAPGAQYQAANDPHVFVARTVGHLLTWTITCCAQQRHVLRSSPFADEPTRRSMADDLAVKARDLMVFAGLIRYHLPARVFEILARAGSDVDSW